MPVRIAFPLLVALTFALTSAALKAQDKVYTSLTTGQIEQLLKNDGIDAKKTPGRTDGIFYYDYKKGNFAIRLHFYQGKDMMLDCLFKDHPLDTLNKWNTKAKFSRASLHRDAKGPFTALESNLDLLGGVTESTVRHFLRTFEDELGQFDKFLGNPPGPGPGPDPVQPPVVAGGDNIRFDISSDRVEGILKALNLTYKKQALKDANSFIYDYESKNFKIRLYNYGGKDMMLDATFKKVPLETTNKWNFQRKFIRAVVYTPNNGNDYTSLETNLDCGAGVSDNMIRHFIITFDVEVQAFVDFLNKN